MCTPVFAIMMMSWCSLCFKIATVRFVCTFFDITDTRPSPVSALQIKQTTEEEIAHDVHKSICYVSIIIVCVFVLSTMLLIY